jgi:hypothetical protein
MTDPKLVPPFPSRWDAFSGQGNVRVTGNELEELRAAAESAGVPGPPIPTPGGWREALEALIIDANRLVRPEPRRDV